MLQVLGAVGVRCSQRTVDWPQWPGECENSWALEESSRLKPFPLCSVHCTVQYTLNSAVVQYPAVVECPALPCNLSAMPLLWHHKTQQYLQLLRTAATIRKGWIHVKTLQKIHSNSKTKKTEKYPKQFRFFLFFCFYFFLFCLFFMKQTLGNILL